MHRDIPASISLPTIYLASQSPRRRQILETLGLPFKVEISPAPEETPSASEVEAATMRNAVAKAKAITDRIDAQGIAIGADTLVILENEVMGKPSSPSHAAETLRKLSGNIHRVVTGMALWSPHFGLRQSYAESRLRFRQISEEEIQNYISTPEPHDKAGAYAVQGLGILFIEHIEGSYTNIMGLPVEKLLRELPALTSIPIHRWFQ